MTANTHQNVSELTTRIFSALIGRRVAEKYYAIDRLRLSPGSVDVTLLRTLLLEALTKTYSVEREKRLSDPTISRTRSWLLAALGAIAMDDQQAKDTIVKHVFADHEPYPWARYWALESLIACKNPNRGEIAKKVIEREQDLLVSMLAHASLAEDDPRSLEMILTGLQDPDRQWFVLRALRMLPVPATIDAICSLVEKSESTDVTYDAIMALGAVPSDWSQAQTCAAKLSASIVKMRDSAWKDSMRAGAVKGLGNLKVESSGSILIEELADDNPAIVREAARACEKVLGLRTTVGRVVEAAAKGIDGGVEIFARALRWLDRAAIADELESLMAAGSSSQQELARAMLSEIGGVVAFEKLRTQRASIKQYSEFLERAEEKIRDLFDDTVHEGQKGFLIATVMDATVFGLGVLLILGSAIAATLDHTLASWAGVGVPGGLGVLGVIYGVLISNPRRQVRSSIDHLMRIKILFLAYLRRLHQADQAYTRRLLDDQPITSAELKGFSDIIGAIMETTAKELPAVSR